MCKKCGECCCSILKFPFKVCCCCCKTTCSMIFGGIFALLVIALIIGLIVYFTVYFNKDNPDQQMQTVNAVITQAPATFKELFKPM